VQQVLLEPSKNAQLRVYAVWFNMFPGDARERWRPGLLTDSRVAHYWDEQKSVGRLYFQYLPQIWEKRAADTITPQDLALWDAYLLYAPDAQWNDRPPEVVSWGATILLTKERLARDLKEVLIR
jgi:hypothetical protein